MFNSPFRRQKQWLTGKTRTGLVRKQRPIPACRCPCWHTIRLHPQVAVRIPAL